MKTRFYILSLLLAGLVILPKVAFSYTMSLNGTKLSLKVIGCKKIGIVVWDQREIVIKGKGKQNESFVGYFRSLAGIPFPTFLEQNQSLAKVVQSKIQNAYVEKAVNVQSVSATLVDNEIELLEELKSFDCEKIIIIKINKLHFDGISKFSYQCDVQAMIYSGKGVLLNTEKIIEEIKMGGANNWQNRFPIMLMSFFERLLNNDEVIKSLQTGQIEPNNLKIPSQNKIVDTTNRVVANTCDLIITTKGEEIKSIILEISEESIKYKLINQQDGPIRILKRESVKLVRYKSGEEEMFK